MGITAQTALPFSYSKICDTFRPRVRQVAATRTDLGGKTFVDLVELCAMPDSLVREELSKGRPAGIEHRLCHGCFRQRRRVDVTHCDIVEVAHQARRQLMVEVASPVRNLGVNGGDAPLLVGPLRHG